MQNATVLTLSEEIAMFAEYQAQTEEAPGDVTTAIEEMRYVFARHKSPRNHSIPCTFHCFLPNLMRITF
jgi:hypothetical protein